MLKIRALHGSLFKRAISSNKPILEHHFNAVSKNPGAEFWDNPTTGQQVWSENSLSNIAKTHKEPGSLADTLALYTVKSFRWGFDTFSGYKFGKLTTKKVLTRAIFLETVAGVPGFAAAILRHLRSLRRMERDNGWINTLLQEAENERMHLLTFIKLQKPSLFFRTSVIITQGFFMNGFFLAYMLSPRFCHRFVGYLEEEAVKTYTDILTAADDGRLPELKTMRAPDIAIQYWGMAEGKQSVRDLIENVRADESNHRDVNHKFADIKLDERNPYVEGKK